MSPCLFSTHLPPHSVCACVQLVSVAMRPLPANNNNNNKGRQQRSHSSISISSSSSNCEPQLAWLTGWQTWRILNSVYARTCRTLFLWAPLRCVKYAICVCAAILIRRQYPQTHTGTHTVTHTHTHLVNLPLTACRPLPHHLVDTQDAKQLKFCCNLFDLHYSEMKMQMMEMKMGIFSRNENENVKWKWKVFCPLTLLSTQTSTRSRSTHTHSNGSGQWLAADQGCMLSIRNILLKN